jgi:hypothetical protein
MQDGERAPPLTNNLQIQSTPASKNFFVAARPRRRTCPESTPAAPTRNFFSSSPRPRTPNSRRNSLTLVFKLSVENGPSEIRVQGPSAGALGRSAPHPTARQPPRAVVLVPGCVPVEQTGTVRRVPRSRPGAVGRARDGSRHRRRIHPRRPPGVGVDGRSVDRGRRR